MQRSMRYPFAFLVSFTLVLLPVASGVGHSARADAPPPRILTAQTPDAVTRGGATLVRHHDSNATLTLDIGLAARDGAGLDAQIAAANDPTSPQYGQHLTNAQYIASYAPTAAQVQAVRDWASGAGLSVDAVSPDNLLVTVHGPAHQVEQALHVVVNDYRDAAHSFYSNDRDATVPGDLDIRAISGLTTIHRFHTMLQQGTGARTRTRALRAGGYYPNDFRAAYNMGPVGDGSGQSIGFTLWGTSVPQSDLNTFASNSGTPAIVGGQAGANGIDWVPVNGGSSDTNELVETAMDVEYAHGVAPNSHLTYWLADCAPDATTGNCNPSDTGLEQAISAAANTTDPNLHVVSNSWGGAEATSTSDPFTSNTNASLQHAASVGITFYFSSGDQGSGSGGANLPSYPADSPYVVSVGGTTLSTGTGYAYSSESAWNGSGGGCSTVFSRPSWQTGVVAATCSGRAEPDVAADADPGSGADVYVNGTSQQIGGTSLAAPLWSGMAADLNRYLGANGKPLMGFSAPRIYQLANNATTYGRDFHDVTSGSNGYPAGPGWDEATGWGSTNLANLAADWAGGATATSTPTNTPPPAATNTPVPAATNTPVSAATNTPIPAATNTPTAGGNCTSDNVCLTGLTASASSVPVNTNVTLTASASTDVGPTPYYILIVDEAGNIVTSCSSGATCSTTVTSAVAATHQYTAYLSGSASSNSAAARSNTVSVSWTSGSPTATPTKPSLPTATPTKPSLPTATNTPRPAATNTPTNTPAPTSTPRPAPTNTPASGGNIVVNPGFESGPGVGWTESSSGGYEVIDTVKPHTGSYSADECNYNTCTEYVQQRITVPSNASLRYWWYMTSQEPTTTAYDYFKVQVYSTGGSLLGTLRTWSNTSARDAWSQDTLSLSAYTGQTVVLRFTTTTDYTLPTNFFVDDVSVP